MPIAGSQITVRPDGEDTLDVGKDGGKATLGEPSASGRSGVKDNNYDSERIRLHEHCD